MENIGREIKRLIKKEKVSVYKIAEDLGLANESLYRSLKNGANPEWKRIRQILDYLGYDLKFIKRRELRPDKLSRSRKGR
jgi:DNA-binding phage protein